MLYLAIPAHNEAATIGVLLWRLRTVLAEFPREYEAVVYDDASSDSTSEILESYARVMPLTVIRGDKPVGYAGAVDALVRHIARQTRYPRRDAMLLMQGDFTDPPAMVPEFVKRFEGGADVVVGERASSALKDAPLPVRRIQQATGWLLRLFVKAEGVRDVTSSFRLIRISVLRDLLRNSADAPVCAGDSQTSNADFLLQLIPLARRVETIAIEPTWGVRIRETRLVATRDGLALARWAWRARGRRAVASTAPDTPADPPRTSRSNRSDRDSSNVLPFEAVDSPRSAHTHAHTHAHSTTRNANAAQPPRKPRAPRAPIIVAESDSDDTAATASTRTRPPRRKRSRSGRKDDVGNEATSVTDEGVSNPAIPFLARDESDDAAGVAPDSIVTNGNGDDLIVHPFSTPLSPVLREAAEDAEAEFDSAGDRPRKRRRRRGGRNRKARGAVDGTETSEPTGEDGVDGQRVDNQGVDEPGDFDSPADSSPYAEDEASNRTSASDARLDDGDENVDDSEGESDSEEPRARRRGRRGRRGGSRRNRGTRADGGEEAPSGLDGASNEPSAYDDGE